MYLYISWAYSDVAEKAESAREAKVRDLIKKGTKESKAEADVLTTKHCLPEYAKLRRAVESGGDDSLKSMDENNANLLSVQLIMTTEKKVYPYDLAGRLPGEGKLPVSLACRSFLLNTFPGKWDGSDDKAKDFPVTLVGLSGLSDFLKDLAIACASLHEPLPADLWNTTEIIELPNDGYVESILRARSYNQEQEHNRERYLKMLNGWMGTGASAARDALLLLSVSRKLGFPD